VTIDRNNQEPLFWKSDGTTLTGSDSQNNGLFNFRRYMKFTSNTRRKAIEYEKALVDYWKLNKTFEKSVEQRSKDESYVFYDGPPFITGEPHHGTLLSSIVKDAIPRYWTMKGKRVERVWGWDCHGLPAEVFTEKKLGVEDRRDIGTKISLEKYITTCRDNMVQTGDLWEDTIDRIGRWVEFDNAYKTMDKEYMESVWWAFKTLHEKGKIYEGERVLMYCTRDATPLAKAEIAMDNSYQTDTDPSVFVKFKLKNEDTYLLAWTTTPWTLPSNSAIGVNKDVEYAEVSVDGETFVLAKDLIDSALTDEKHNVVEHELLRTFNGSELVGKSYEPLFEPVEDLIHANAFKIWHADFVTAEQGTGIAHESPAYGEEDYDLSREHDIPWVMSTDENGFFTMGPWEGHNVWEVNKQIAKDMHSTEGVEAWRGAVWKIDYIRHEYPHCYRCDTKLMYRAHPSWFMDIAGQKDRMLELNEDINWFPEHIKNGRFQKTVESAPDWNLSRDRFWATAMPVWKGVGEDGKTHTKVVGSYAELKELSGVELDDYHRPWVDDIVFTIDGVEYKRIEKVMDCWFESGSMPFAQFHYPFENKEKFESSFPSDFIVEYVGQVRAWFYYMHAVAIGLFDEVSFKNVIVTGSVAGNDGRKMSKSFGNYTDPNELMDEYSADALRFTLLSSPLLNGEDYALIDKNVKDNHRKLAMVWNMYDFFTMYAEVDGWQWKGELSDPSSDVENPLDSWILSRVHQLNQEVEQHLQNYDIPNAMKPILPFIDDASNWYIRRSRRRFWKSDDDDDKQQAYRTLHYVLTQLSLIVAPFTPFLAEELYQKLTGGESVHLLDWPEVGYVNEQLTKDMKSVRESISEALNQRARNQLKVRQPLASVSVPEVPEQYREIIAEEVNVKEVVWAEEVEIDTTISPELKREGLMREVVRHIQSTRKKAQLDVDDRIKLSLTTESTDLQAAIDEHLDIIKQETLAAEVSEDGFGYQELVKIEGEELEISLETA